MCYCICLYDLLGSPDSSVGKALDLYWKVAGSNAGLEGPCGTISIFLPVLWNRHKTEDPNKSLIQSCPLIKFRGKFHIALLFRSCPLIKFLGKFHVAHLFKVALLLDFEEICMLPSYSKSPSYSRDESSFLDKTQFRKSPIRHFNMMI